jgi:type I restriction enzyme S subunit
MKRWPTKPLGELCDVEGGNAAPQGHQHFKDGTIPFVRMKDLGRYHFTNWLCETTDKLTEASAIANRMKFFEPGCILFPRSGSVALNHRAILGVHACVVSHIGVLQNLRPEILSSYLYYYLTTFDMTALSKKTTGVDSIAFSDVKQIPVPVPTLGEQERIVNLLDKADKLRKLRAGADSRISALLPGLFHEMFGDPALTGNRWPKVPLKKLGTITTGNTPSRKNLAFFGDFIEWIKTNNIDAASGIVTRAAEGLSETGTSQGRIVPAGAVLITCIAGSRNLIGDAAVVDRDVAINQQINAFIPNANSDSAFICQQIRALKGVIQKRATGVMTGIVNKSTLGNISIISPPLRLQKQFSARAAEIRALEADQAANRNRLDNLFQSLLHRAFQGEL